MSRDWIRNFISAQVLGMFRFVLKLCHCYQFLFRAACSSATCSCDIPACVVIFRAKTPEKKVADEVRLYTLNTAGKAARSQIR